MDCLENFKRYIWENVSTYFAILVETIRALCGQEYGKQDRLKFFKKPFAGFYYSINR